MAKQLLDKNIEELKKPGSKEPYFSVSQLRNIKKAYKGSVPAVERVINLISMLYAFPSKMEGSAALLEQMQQDFPAIGASIKECDTLAATHTIHRNHGKRPEFGPSAIKPDALREEKSKKKGTERG